ncbi:hypothetical protein Tco_0410666 [Tanacetum coccineum]
MEILLEPTSNKLLRSVMKLHHGESDTICTKFLRFELKPCQERFFESMITGLDDGVAASFQRSRIHKPHAHTHAFKVNRSTSRSLILNFPTIKEPQSQIKNSLFGEDC